MAPAFHVAVVGGGIGGLACVLSLAYHNPSSLCIDVYEQAAQYSEIGAGVGIGVNAAKILHRLGVGAEVNAISGWRNDIHRSLRRWDNGAEIVTIGADFEEGEIKQLSVHRAELLEVLYRAIEKRGIAKLHTNKRCVRVDDAGHKVVASFDDGTSTTVDLLVGADGIHSNIRQQFVADGKPRYSGRIAYRGLFPLKDVESFWPFDSYAVSWLGKDKHLLVFPVSQNKTMNVVAFITKSEDELGNLKESWTSVGNRDDLEREYEGWHETVGKVIRCLGPNPGKWRLNDRDPVEQWTYMGGKTVLLGDAAHAMLPHQGSGAGHAIEDGYILGRALKDYLTSQASPNPRPLSTWTDLYQRVRLPRTQKAQITSRQAGDVYEMQGKLFEGLTYDQGIPVVREKLQTRMKWVWGANIDGDYDQAVAEAGLRP